MACVAYGLNLETTFNLEDLSRSTTGDATAVLEVERVERLSSFDGRLLQTLNTGTRTVQIYENGSSLVYLIDHLVSFELLVKTNRIRCFLSAEASDALLRYWLLHRILPIYRILSGSHIFLHAAAVGVEVTERGSETRCSAGCIAFFGPSYSGKSTMLSYFLSAGHALVTDDHLALSSAVSPASDCVEIAPGTPYYRPYRAVEDLGLVADNFCPEPLPLQQLYVLEPAAADAEIRMEALKPFEVLELLLEDLQYSAHESTVPEYRSVIENRFRGFSHIARQVPTWRLYVPRSMDRLPDVYRHIRNNLEKGRSC